MKLRILLSYLLVLFLPSCTLDRARQDSPSRQEVAGASRPQPVRSASASLKSDPNRQPRPVATGVAGRDVKEASDRESSADGGFNTEAYDSVVDNPFFTVLQNPLSTFSIDVDTASYANVRRLLKQGTRPPKGAVRIEEFVNYFSYDDREPEGEVPFSVAVEVAACPWKLDHRLARIALKGREIPSSKRPPANLVFLLDVSGSMSQWNKLPLLKAALKMLVNNLEEKDRVAVVVYAGASGLVLPSTPAGDRQRILEALGRLRAGGSTNAGSGIELAYNVAAEGFVKGGINRVILATDGDFNVGITNQSSLVELIEKKAKSGVFLTVLGFGMGNYKDSTLEKLADKGNGNYAYIDTAKEAQKVLVEQIGATLMTIAKDVKLQLEFNPATVAGYRLIGYENRLLRDQDFNDDTIDAGEIGAGHSVTALYEIIPAGKEVPGAQSVDPLKYQSTPSPDRAAGSGDLFTVKLRYKDPAGSESKLLEHPVQDRGVGYEKASDDFRFAASVAAFGMLLRDSPYKGSTTWAAVLELAEDALGADKHGYRREFLELARLAKSLEKN